MRARERWSWYKWLLMDINLRRVLVACAPDKLLTRQPRRRCSRAPGGWRTLDASFMCPKGNAADTSSQQLRCCKEKSERAGTAARAHACRPSRSSRWRKDVRVIERAGTGTTERHNERLRPQRDSSLITQYYCMNQVSFASRPRRTLQLKAHCPEQTPAVRGQDTSWYPCQ